MTNLSFQIQKALESFLHITCNSSVNPVGSTLSICLECERCSLSPPPYPNPSHLHLCWSHCMPAWSPCFHPCSPALFPAASVGLFISKSNPPLAFHIRIKSKVLVMPYEFQHKLLYISCLTSLLKPCPGLSVHQPPRLASSCLRAFE